jgi:hypothetical protein
MKEGILRLKTRLALAFYLIARLNLDLLDDLIRPERKQICLINAAEIDAAREAAKAATRERLALRKAAANLDR